MTRADARKSSPRKVLTAFGTRPELIKLGPVLAELETRADDFRTINVNTGQHADLLAPFLKLFGTRIDHDLEVMRPGQALNPLFARILNDIDPLLESHRPDVVLVQGDTTTAAAVALAAFQRKIPVGHVEAGLRTDDPQSPFPEEMNRRLISRVARWHFAGTTNHVRTLRREGVPREDIFRTGNPVVDALNWIGKTHCSPALQDLLNRTAGLKRIAFTSHRRENFASLLEENLRVIRRFVERHADTAVIFPMHPNPVVREKAYSILAGVERIHLIEPLDYVDFIRLLSESWLIASDSGGIQEEAPSLGKPLLILRESTERQEVLETGLAKLAVTPEQFETMLREQYWSGELASPVDAATSFQLVDKHGASSNPAQEVAPESRRRFGNSSPRPVTNPFGDGRASRRIANVLQRVLPNSEVPAKAVTV